MVAILLKTVPCREYK